MQTAQKAIAAYRRKRILTCLIVALLTLTATLLVRFITQRSVNQQRIQMDTARIVLAMDKVLQPVSAQYSSLLPLVGQPCENIRLPLSKIVASLQTVRSIVLIKSNVLYCSSIFGTRERSILHIPPKLPYNHPLLAFAIDKTMMVGSPILIQWYPSPGASQESADGVMLVINIALLGDLILDSRSPLITHIGLNIGTKTFINGIGISDRESIAGEPIIYQQRSTHFPFTISVSGPGASIAALRGLPRELPLALILSLLTTGIGWIITSGRMSFSREINLAISAHEFEVWCQPLEDIRQQKCCGVEILLRWNNPRLGHISPDVFIPLAESHNLIVPLTRYVIAETARQLFYFPKEKAFHIGINVAARHFTDGELMRDLHRYWFSAHPVQQLVIELTERDVLQDGDRHITEHLHSKGVQLAIDDFGTGSSSLSWLEQLHPDMLKIDKTFINAIGIDSVNATVADMIISLARRLKILTVAEGVESEEQAEYLSKHGVDILQGFRYARPMPISEFPQWLEKQRLKG